MLSRPWQALRPVSGSARLFAHLSLVLRRLQSSTDTSSPRLRIDLLDAELAKALACCCARVLLIDVDHRRSRIVFQLSEVLSSLR